MNWSLVVKLPANPPTVGHYRQWKSSLAIEARNRCVYCSVHDARFAGPRNFHVEHFKPKSRFPKLEKDYANLFFACPVCNVFKGDDWFDAPARAFDQVHYPHPCDVDYGTLFSLNHQTGVVAGKNVAASYIVHKLGLNRAQLILDRRLNRLLLEYKSAQDRLVQVQGELVRYSLSTGDPEAIVLFSQVVTKLLELKETFVRLINTTPATQKDMERPNGQVE